MAVPLFNRNKGSIQAAGARQQQAETLYQQSLLSAELEIERLEQQVRALMALVSRGLQIPSNSDIEAEQNVLMEQATQQYLRRNISIIEFSSLLEAYRETMLAAIDNQTNLQKAVAELKRAKGI